MRLCFRVFITISVAFIVAFGFSDEHKPLAQLYKTGKVRFVQELALDEKTMPKDVLFVHPTALDCDAAGNVYVLDDSDNNIKVFDVAGKFLRVIGRKGQGPGEFNMPAGLAVIGDRLIVLDMGNRRICALNLSGEYMKAENYAVFSGMPWNLEALPNGEIVLETEKIYYNEPDRPQDRFLSILSPDLKAMKIIYSRAVMHNKYIRVGGTLWNVTQPFCPDFYWDVPPSGKIIVGFSEKYEICAYGKDGAKLFSFTHSYEPVKVTAGDQKDFFDSIVYATETGSLSGAPEPIVKNTTFPKVKPAFNGLIVDSDGNILVHTYQKKAKDMYRYFDAFDPTGKFIATVHVEGNVQFPVYKAKSRMVNGCLWVVEQGGDEMPHVVKYRISE